MEDRRTYWDKVVGYFNPMQNLVRMKARDLEHHVHKFSQGYNDRPESRSFSGGMFAQGSAETWKSSRDRIKAMWDARDLCRFDFIGGMIARIVLYTCGQLHSKSLTGEPQIDEIYDEYFHGWCGDIPSDDGLVRCDITGRNRFLKMVQMAFGMFLIDGDHGFIMIDKQFSPTGEFTLQAIEADRIGSPIEAQVQENYIGGFSLDPDTGRVSSVRIFRRTRTNQYLDPTEVPIQSFIHVFDPERPDEYRGRTRLLRILNDARDIREWVEAEKIAGKTQSQWAALVGVKDPFANKGPTAWSDTTTEGTPSQKAEWGKIMKMAEGEVFNMLAPPSRPSGAFMQFIEMIIRKMAVALDLPYGFLWDLATLGGVTARIEVQQALRRIEYWQNQLLVDKVLDRVRQRVIAEGIGLGLIPPHPNWRKASWHFGLSIQTDVGYEMDADIAAINAGILPISEITGKYGNSPIDVFRANANTANEAIMVGSETNVPAEVFARGLFPDITAQKAAITTPPSPPPPPGSQEALGEKGVAQLIDILENVGEGKMDRDAAKQVLKRTFGIPEAIAEKMVPDEPTPAKLAATNRANGTNGSNGSRGQPAKQKVARKKATNGKTR